MKHQQTNEEQSQASNNRKSIVSYNGDRDVTRIGASLVHFNIHQAIHHFRFLATLLTKPWQCQHLVLGYPTHKTLQRSTQLSNGFVNLSQFTAFDSLKCFTNTQLDYRTRLTVVPTQNSRQQQLSTQVTHTVHCLRSTSTFSAPGSWLPNAKPLPKPQNSE